MGEEQAVETQGNAVVLEYEHQQADFADAVRLILRKRGKAGLVYHPAFLVAFGLLGLAMLVLDLRAGEDPLLSVMFVVWPALMSLMPRLSARRSLRAVRHQGRLRVTVTGEGIHALGAHTETRSAWAAYGSYAESGRVFILRGPDLRGRRAMVLVKRGAADPADVDRLRALLDRHLARA